MTESRTPGMRTPSNSGASDAYARLLARLQVRQGEVLHYVGVSPVDTEGGRVFGGLLLAQTLRAASAGVPSTHLPQQLDMHFLAPARQGATIDYRVAEVKVGKTVWVRSVEVLVGDATIATATATFGSADAEGVDLTRNFRPSELPTADGHIPASFHRDPAALGWEFRELAVSPVHDGMIVGPARRFWARTGSASLDDVARSEIVAVDGLTDYCLVAYLSDFGTAWGVGRAFDQRLALLATVSHSVWFHRPIACADWVYGELTPESVTGTRGVVTGGLYRADGAVGATLAQHVLARPRREV